MLFCSGTHNFLKYQRSHWFYRFAALKAQWSAPNQKRLWFFSPGCWSTEARYGNRYRDSHSMGQLSSSPSNILLVLLVQFCSLVPIFSASQAQGCAFLAQFVAEVCYFRIEGTKFLFEFCLRSTIILPFEIEAYLICLLLFLFFLFAPWVLVKLSIFD